MLGETEGDIDSHKVRIYDRDRTICDVLRNMNKMDKEIHTFLEPIFDAIVNEKELQGHWNFNDKWN